MKLFRNVHLLDRNTYKLSFQGIQDFVHMYVLVAIYIVDSRSPLL